MKIAVSPLGLGVFLLLSGAGVARTPPIVVQGQSLSSWKTVTNKDVGVSFLMPPGAKVEPEVDQDEKTGAKVVILQAFGETPSSLYIVAAVRLNKDALEELRKATPADKEPLDSLYQARVQPQIDRLLKIVREDPKHGTLTRKPLTWHGLTGEEIFAKLPAQKDKGGVMRIRLFKTQTGFFLMIASERTPSAASSERMNRFLESFTLLPDAPALDAPLPTPPVPEAPVPDAPQTAPPAQP